MSESWTRGCGKAGILNLRNQVPILTEEEQREEEESKDEPPLGPVLPPVNGSEPRKAKGGVIPP